MKEGADQRNGTRLSSGSRADVAQGNTYSKRTGGRGGGTEIAQFLCRARECAEKSMKRGRERANADVWHGQQETADWVAHRSAVSMKGNHRSVRNVY